MRQSCNNLLAMRSEIATKKKCCKFYYPRKKKLKILSTIVDRFFSKRRGAFFSYARSLGEWLRRKDLTWKKNQTKSANDDKRFYNFVFYFSFLNVKYDARLRMLVHRVINLQQRYTAKADRGIRKIFLLTREKISRDRDLFFVRCRRLLTNFFYFLILFIAFLHSRLSSSKVLMSGMTFATWSYKGRFGEWFVIFFRRLSFFFVAALFDLGKPARRLSRARFGPCASQKFATKALESITGKDSGDRQRFINMGLLALSLF